MDYSKMSVIELKKLCKDKKMKGYSKMKKRELIDKLQGNKQVFVSPKRPSLKPRKRTDKIGPPKTPMSPLLRRIIKKNKK